jgi:hypothetical protein
MTSKNSTILNEHDVINTRSNILIHHQTFTSEELLEKMRSTLSIHRSDCGSYGWIGEGVNCEVLACQNNIQGWQSGKVRIVLEFIPDEISEPIKPIGEELDSPLDDIRQSIEQNLILG